MIESDRFLKDRSSIEKGTVIIILSLAISILAVLSIALFPVTMGLGTAGCFLGIDSLSDYIIQAAGGRGKEETELLQQANQLINSLTPFLEEKS